MPFYAEQNCEARGYKVTGKTPKTAFMLALGICESAISNISLGKLLLKKGESMASKIRIKLRSYDHNLIDTAAARIIDAAVKAGCSVSGPVPLPTEKEIITVIRSPHKYKDSREQFELRTHKRIIDVYNSNTKAVDMLMKLELPAGVDVKIKL